MLLKLISYLPGTPYLELIKNLVCPECPGEEKSQDQFSFVNFDLLKNKFDLILITFFKNSINRSKLTSSLLLSKHAQLERKFNCPYLFVSWWGNSQEIKNFVFLNVPSLKAFPVLMVGENFAQTRVLPSQLLKSDPFG